MVTELFITGRKLNITPVFITQSYFEITKDDRLNSTHYFIVKISNRQELKQITINHSSDIDFKGYMKLCKYTTKSYFFLVNGTILLSNNLLHFR